MEIAFFFLLIDILDHLSLSDQRETVDANEIESHVFLDIALQVALNWRGISFTLWAFEALMTLLLLVSQLPPILHLCNTR